MRRGWRMVGPGELAPFEEPVAPPRPDRVVVKVSGCGVCHTDLGFLYGGVRPKHSLPLVLGHEISGVVVDVGANAAGWLHQRVLVPAVSACGQCRFCAGGRPTSCRASLMPGSDEDGGFATHVEVPAATLCRIDAREPAPEDAPIGKHGLALWELAVIADAVTTPLQAIFRCGLSSGEVAVVIGAGGVGGYAIQIARTLGAWVVAIDIAPEKLERARPLGASLALEGTLATKTIRQQIAVEAEKAGLPSDGWRIFECSGTPAGQELGWSLLTYGGSISVIGYTPERAPLRLSNLMAFDATAFGNWGCDAALYPEALELVRSGQVQVRGNIVGLPLSDTPRILEAAHRGEHAQRVVLIPNP